MQLLGTKLRGTILWVAHNGLSGAQCEFLLKNGEMHRYAHRLPDEGTSTNHRSRNDVLLKSTESAWCATAEQVRELCKKYGYECVTTPAAQKLLDECKF